MTIDLPSPPTANTYWRKVGNRMLLSAAARQFKARVAMQCLLAGWRPVQGPVAVTIIWRRDRKSGDLDNRIKPTLDALAGYAYHNDKQVREIHAYMIDGEAPGASVTIESRAA